MRVPSLQGFPRSCEKQSTQTAVGSAYPQVLSNARLDARPYRIELVFTPGPDAVRVAKLCSVRAGVKLVV